MNARTAMLCIVAACVTLGGLSLVQKRQASPYAPLAHVSTETRSWNTPTVYTAPYVSKEGVVNPQNVQCPIPMKDRVKNYTGIQCVYSSIEMLGRWAEEPKLTDPPITSRSDCKGYSSPGRAAQILNKLNVKFEQTNGDRAAGIRLIKKAMEEGRGALFGVPGHAMVLIHYSEEEDRVCWVDNSDSSLKVQTMSISRFKQRWDSWVLVIYADRDIVPAKMGGRPWNIPIRDPEGREFPENYIPIPGPTRKAA